jgi:putative DNA-invertase from lambdoid prophage Rac
LLLHILAAVAEFERELIRERVRAGVANAKRNGKQLGRPKVIFDRQKAMDMRAAGISLPKIAKRWASVKAPSFAYLMRFPKTC